MTNEHERAALRAVADAGTISRLQLGRVILPFCTNSPVDNPVEHYIWCWMRDGLLQSETLDESGKWYWLTDQGRARLAQLEGK